VLTIEEKAWRCGCQTRVITGGGLVFAVRHSWCDDCVTIYREALTASSDNGKSEARREGMSQLELLGETPI